MTASDSPPSAVTGASALNTSVRYCLRPCRASTSVAAPTRASSTARCAYLPRPATVHASYDSLLLYQHRPSRRCFLRDPFSGAGATPAIEVPCRYKRRANRPHDVTGTCNPMPGNPCSVLKIVVQSPQLVVAMFLAVRSTSHQPPTLHVSCRAGRRRFGGHMRPARPLITTMVWTFSTWT